MALPVIDIPVLTPGVTYQLPYDREVKFIRSNGMSWFGEVDGTDPFPDQPDHKEPYDFYPPSTGLYCVVDNEGTPCLYNAVTGEFMYNLGRGKLFGMETVHTHDALFPTEGADRILRSVKSGAEVLTTQDTNYAYMLSDTLPDPNTIDGKVIVPKKPLGGFARGQVLVATLVGGRYVWKPLEKPTDGVDIVSNIRGYKQGYVVSIRWNDPPDVYNAMGTEVVRAWKYTRLVRKLNSVPRGPNDGVIVINNATRDNYSTYKHDLVDHLPPNVKGSWYYKFFCYSNDGVVTTSSAAEFSPLDMDWAKMSQYIQDGLAPIMFAVGDEIELTPDAGDYYSYTNNYIDDQFYANLTFQVVGFDIAAAPGKRHSMTLMAKFAHQYHKRINFDDAWGSYRQVTEGTVDKSVTYYGRSGSSYVVLNPQPVAGTTITRDSGYYIRVTDSKKDTGSNLWSESMIRKWANATDIYHYARSQDTLQVEGKHYFIKNSDGSYTEAAIQPGVRYNPYRLGWQERTGLIDFGTTLTPFMKDPVDGSLIGQAPTPPLMVLRAVEPNFAKCIAQQRNITAVDPDQDAYPSEITLDYVSLPSYTEYFGSNAGSIKEGTPFPDVLFEGEDGRRKHTNGSSAYCRFWLRSPQLQADGNVSKVNVVETDGTVTETQTAVVQNYENFVNVAMVLVLG